jgi:hypothetical protein
VAFSKHFCGTSITVEAYDYQVGKVVETLEDWQWCKKIAGHCKRKEPTSFATV